MDKADKTASKGQQDWLCTYNWVGLTSIAMKMQQGVILFVLDRASS